MLIPVALAAILALRGPVPLPGGADVITGMDAFISRDAVHPGETFKAAVSLKIGPGWHINANPASDEFLIPTSLEIGDKSGPFHVLDVLYPEPAMVRLGFSESAVAVYSDSALIGVLVRADGSLRPGTYELKGNIVFQACNDVSCLPPDRRDFELEIVVVPAGAETHDAHREVFKGLKFRPETAGR